jgi:catalase
MKIGIEPISTCDTNNDQLAHRLKSMNPKEREQLIENMAEELLFAEDEVQKAIVSFFMRADKGMATSLEKWLGL